MTYPADEIEIRHANAHAPFGCPYSDERVHECGLRARIVEAYRAENIGLAPERGDDQ